MSSTTLQNIYSWPVICTLLYALPCSRKRLDQARQEHRQLQQLLVHQRVEQGRSQQLTVAWQRRLDKVRNELFAYLVNQEQHPGRQRYSKVAAGEIMRILDDSMIYYLCSRYGGGAGTVEGECAGDDWMLSPEMLLLLIGHPLGGGGASSAGLLQTGLQGGTE